ncbi:MAG: ribbon-helix-helix protein, CopG family [Proteobacteria bacterium]|nr:ribbon-helix-helix protein, CopG family [Pseudomonadota bacterium]MBU1641299.1 ribbon-helix-helix protein, CopG family [Pseudomonadota bacterium]
MQAVQSSNLVRKQYLISTNQIEKLDRLAKEKGSSAAEIVRQAIDAYEPDFGGMDAPELMELVAVRVKEAIEDTRNTRARLSQTLKQLGVEGA